MTGLTIGDYALGDRVGSGGVGDVYRATDLMLEREVAIKFLRPGLGAQPEVVERFRSEARTLAQLNHPNIATLFALHREGDTLAMIMEFVHGKTVSTLLRERGPLPLDVALTICLQALDGLGCAHASGVVHRDLKPSNLMLDRRGILKVMDFGIARCIGASRLTRTGSTVGTAHYMAPEQVRGQETDLRADLYSLCIVLYEMLTDHVPFDSEVEYEVMRSHVEIAPTPPRSYRVEIPEAMEEVILRGLSKDPAARFASTEELRDALCAAGDELRRLGNAELGKWMSDVQRPQVVSPPSDESSGSHTDLVLTDPLVTSAGPATTGSSPLRAVGTSAFRAVEDGAFRAGEDAALDAVRSSALRAVSKFWELPTSDRTATPTPAGNDRSKRPTRVRRRASGLATQATLALVLMFAIGSPNVLQTTPPTTPPTEPAHAPAAPDPAPVPAPDPEVAAPDAEPPLGKLWLPIAIVTPGSTRPTAEPALASQPRPAQPSRVSRPVRPPVQQAMPRRPQATTTPRVRPEPRKPQTPPADEARGPQDFQEGKEAVQPGANDWLIRR